MVGVPDVREALRPQRLLPQEAHRAPAAAASRQLFLNVLLRVVSWRLHHIFPKWLRAKGASRYDVRIGGEGGHEKADVAREVA